jgi:hypothetical protein
VFVGTAPYSTFPVVSKSRPFLVKIASREFTVWTM